MLSRARFGLAAGVWMGMTGAAGADTFQFTIDPGQSALTLSVHNGVDISGTFIGNYDADTNPDGTMTRPGLFGGNGNQPIPYTTESSLDGDEETSPAGGFRFTLDTETLALTVNGLALDLLNGAEPALPLTVALDFDTFRTFNPNSLYLGGILPPIELGEGTVSQLTAVQSGAGGGVLTPAGEGEYTFEALVESEVTLVMFLLGQDVTPEPLAVPLALAGTITINGDGTATVSMSLDQEIMQVIEPEDSTFADVPLDLPTILPPGEIAHLLMSGSVDKVTLDMAFGLKIEASGEGLCAADFDGNGVLDIFDFLAFQNAFAAKEPSADFNGDGSFDLFDFLAFVNAFSDGC